MGLVYLPTWMVDFLMINVGKSTTHGMVVRWSILANNSNPQLPKKGATSVFFLGLWTFFWGIWKTKAPSWTHIVKARCIFPCLAKVDSKSWARKILGQFEGRNAWQVGVTIILMSLDFRIILGRSKNTWHTSRKQCLQQSSYSKKNLQQVQKKPSEHELNCHEFLS